MWSLYPFRASSRSCTNPLSRRPPPPCPVMCNTHRTVTIHDTRLAYPQHKREFVVQISSWARTTTLVHHRQSADWAGIHFARCCYYVDSTTRSRVRVYFFGVLSIYIVVQAQTQNSLYSQCTPNYCVTRLRRLCSLCAFVRVGIGEEDIVQPPKPLVKDDTQGMPSPLTTARMGNQLAGGTTLPSASEKPPVPPRRRRIWEMASASGERAVSWGKGSGGKREG